jgi:hypothetical protein
LLVYLITLLHVVAKAAPSAFGAVALPADGEVPLQQEAVEAVAAEKLLGAAGEPGPRRRLAHQPETGHSVHLASRARGLVIIKLKLLFFELKFFEIFLFIQRT